MLVALCFHVLCTVFKMSGLLECSCDVVGVLVSIWLDVKSVGKLDSAFCSTKTRISFLDLISSQYFC